MAELIVNSESLVSVADAIREKGGTTDSLEFPQGFVDAVGDIPSGGTEEVENIIDESGVLESTEGTATEKVELLLIYTDYVKKTTSGKNSEIVIAPPLDYSNITNLNSRLSSYKNLEYIMGEINCANCASAAHLVSGCSKLTAIKLSNTGKIKTIHNAFNGCLSLETISLLDFSSSTDVYQTFKSCNALENISFVAETIKVSIAIPSPVLSAESVQSIIDGLAYVETSQNLTLSNQIVLTDNQKQVINAKGWTLIQ